MLKVLDHPLISHKLSVLRNIHTSTEVFRRSIREISSLMVYELTANLPQSDEIEIETPLHKLKTKQIGCEIFLIPILRAGLGMVEGITYLLPDAKIGHIGMHRNERTLEPVSYYTNLPTDLSHGVAMILDPMLATGGTACAAINKVKSMGAMEIKLICIVGAPEGVKKIESEHPDTEIILAALDEKLNKKGYIIPGLGDAGDRLFGTK